MRNRQSRMENGERNRERRTRNRQPRTTGDILLRGKIWSSADLYRQNGKAAKSKSEICNDRTNGSIIKLHVKTAGDLAKQLRKSTGYMLPSFIYPTAAQSLLSSPFGILLGKRERVTPSMIGHVCTVTVCP